MNDMTKGPVAGHVVRLSGFIAASTAFQTLYFLADLYFVGKLGKEAVAERWNGLWVDLSDLSAADALSLLAALPPAIKKV